MDPSASFTFGIIMGIVMIWMGIIAAIASRAVVKGEMTSEDNYRPFQSKYVKKLTLEDANAINHRFSKYALCWGYMLILAGIVSIVPGILYLGDYVLLVFAIIIIPMIVLIPYAYYAAYKAAKAKDEANAVGRAQK